jgi:photosystem II stability/assembly factor-like uncharacterized protein
MRYVPRPFMTVRIAGAILALLALVASARTQTWKPLGPPGGDVRVLAADPNHPGKLFLGTADGHIFGSKDSGANWALLGRAGHRQDAVITAIVVDPRDGNVVFASAWTRDSAAGGGVFESGDGGRNWSAAGLSGEAVRALAMSPSDPDILIAGTLNGVYRSRDAARSWERISPEHDRELKNLDSLAFDPRDPQIIYAGTFHLPWKTTDGGRTWQPVHQGMIDDSDVMSLRVDESDARRVYASACSGIYRSDDGAGQWRKIQGIPYAARRTYAIAQDPRNPASVYAATSEGLWKTSDSGMTWRRTTPESWVVNTAVVVAGAALVLIGTEKLGVLVSDDEGEHFREANNGFNHRQIIGMGLDGDAPGRILALLADASEPLQESDDGGQSWFPVAGGLGAEVPTHVFAAPGRGWWIPLARGGLMRYDAQAQEWRPSEIAIGHADRSKANRKSGGGPSVRKTVKDAKPLREVVADMAFSSNAWYAATGSGLLVSIDGGATWMRRPISTFSSLPVESVVASPDGQRIRVVSLRGLVFSNDGGRSWTWHDLPLQSGGAISLNGDPADENTLVASAHNGLYISRDSGNTWELAGSGLPSTPVQSFAARGEMFVASMRTGGLFVSSDAGKTWFQVPGVLADGVFGTVAVGNEEGEIIAASTTEGLSVHWISLMPHTLMPDNADSPDIPHSIPASEKNPRN